MLRSWTIILILFLVHCKLVSATNYYISSKSIDDSKDGKTESTAWKTISKINNSTFKPGDSIFFKKGDVWRETLNVPSSGDTDHYIYFGSYGTGAKPIIYGSTQLLTWTKTTGNIWESATSVSNPSTYGNIFFIANSTLVTIWGIRKTYTADYSNLTAEYNWTFSSNKVYIYSTSDPVNAYNKIEAAQRISSINLNNKNYIEVNGIEMLYAAWLGVEEYGNGGDFTGFTMRNCTIAYCGDKNGYGYGVGMCYTNMLIEYNTIHDCGRRGLSIVNYSSANHSKIVIQYNTFYNGFHTTSLDVETGSNAASTGDTDSVIFRNNLVYDDPNASITSNSLFAQGPHGGSGNLTNVYIYNNIFKHTSGAAVSIEDVDGSYIYNNTFYGHNASLSATYHVYLTDGATRTIIKNNIFYTAINFETQAAGAELVLYGVSSAEVQSDYNLYYRINNNLRIMMVNGSTYYMNRQANIISAYGWEKHSLFTDPLFISSSDYHLQDSSPVIGKGIKVSFIKKDFFDGEFFGDPPSIGAYEGIKGYIPPTPPPPDDNMSEQILILYPNPSYGFVTISRDGSVLTSQKFRIIDLSGKTVYEGLLEEGVKIEQFPINLRAGIYVLQVISGNLTVDAKMLIVVAL